jgi:hypothetical protein
MTVADVALVVAVMLLAAVLFPLPVISVLLLGILSGFGFIWFLVWLDLDKLAITLGPLCVIGFLYCVPWAMRDQIWRHPAFVRLVGANSFDDLIQSRNSDVRIFVMTCILAGYVALSGTLAVRASVQLFEFAEQTLDGGMPS